ncbi:MAG TPA: DNA ligase D [Chitinophagaceae bacterium]|nr:DNA ligase D [Chitinophagaceae bacterium]
MTKLQQYKAKRNFSATPEPAGKQVKNAKALRFVVQRHQASRLHYDFRLEIGGVLVSWAVPKGPSMNTTDKRLAVHVEDHPVDYIDFEGEIPKGNYGAGIVEVWDHGTFIPVDGKQNPITEKKAEANIAKGELKFILNGKKLKGGFVLVQLKDEKNWLLIKHKDEFAVEEPYDSEDLVKPGLQKKNKKTSSIARSPFTGKEKKLTKFIKPMLASLHSEPFDDPEWLYEIKWDGYRAIAELNDHEIRLYSRNGLWFNTTFAPIVKELELIKHDAVLDGEIVVLDNEGKPSFQLLQLYREDPAHPIIYYVFDLLKLDKKDIHSLPLVQRKELLKHLLAGLPNKVIRYCDHIPGKGISFFREVSKLGLEGMIAKKADSEYASGIRSRQWLKVKNINTAEALIVGFTEPRGSRKHFGALILGEYDGAELKYIGHTGTGFDDKLLKELWNTMKPLTTGSSPFSKVIKVNAPVTWLKPELVCSVKFTERTREGLLRHPVFMGLRPDKSAKEVIKNNDAMPVRSKKQADPEPESLATVNEKIVKSDGGQVKLTNINKLYWPDEKITKGQMLEYYEKIAPVILPYLKDRPLSLNRMPNGIKTKGFYHKDAGENVPSFVVTEQVQSESSDKTIDYILCNNTATLLYVANLGSIEMNPWNSTRRKPDHPTYIVIDVDPSAHNTFSQVIDTALAATQVLERAGATYYVKTSGATGLHIYIPLGAKYEYGPARDFAHVIAMLTNELVPEFTSLERNLKKRGDRIYIDYLQNSKGQTLASAYSVRPVPGAQVSAPITLKELNYRLSPDQFNIFNIEKRIKKLGDIFYMVLGKGNNIRNCLRNLGH